MTNPAPQHLGDGVYVSPWEMLGCGITLTTGGYEPQMGSNTIHLDPAKLRAFLNYIRKCYPQYIP